LDKLLSTREVAEILGVNEKMVYTLINEKGLPATRITGKWLFPKNLVEQWVESKTINYPQSPASVVAVPNLLLIAGSNDILLDVRSPCSGNKTRNMSPSSAISQSRGVAGTEARSLPHRIESSGPRE